MTSQWQPKWSSQVRIESGGRYPLGLNRFHEGLESFLIKGIVEAANRLRYITYCCWVLGDIQKNENCENYVDFVQAFRNRENALALGLYMGSPDHSVYGSDAMAKIVSDDIDEYGCTFKLMQSKDLGAYGLYYAGTMFNWGLTETDKNGIVHLTQSGLDIYNIMERYIAEVQPEYYVDYKGKEKVPKSVLLSWAEICNFNNIKEPGHSAERAYYKSILFRLNQPEGQDLRRDTFMFVLECINHCDKSNTEFTEEVLRNIHFYTSYIDDTGNVLKFDLPEKFTTVHFYWSIYEVHVYFRWWLSRLFHLFLSYLKSSENGATVNEFLAAIDVDIFNATIASSCGTEKDHHGSHMAGLLELVGEHEGLSQTLSVETTTNDEKDTLRAKKESISETAARFLVVCAGLYLKSNSLCNNQSSDYHFIMSRLSGDLWFDNLRQERNLEAIGSIDFLGRVLKQYILDQHDSIMIEKHDLRRCWFTIENNRYYHQADASLIWRPAKFSTIINFLSDMNLVENGEKKLCLSDEGQIFHQELIEGLYK